MKVTYQFGGTPKRSLIAGRCEERECASLDRPQLPSISVSEVQLGHLFIVLRSDIWLSSWLGHGTGNSG